jgi:hypothetical protein
MAPRIVFLAIAGLVSAAAEESAQPPRCAEAAWSKETASPVVRLGNGNWFAGVIPASVPLEGLTGPMILFGEKEQASRIVFLDPGHRLCFLETDNPVEGLAPLVLAASRSAKPGKLLHCRSDAGTCRTTVAGKDRSYLGEPLSQPLLRVRIEDAEHFCRPGMPLFNRKGELEGILTDRDLASKNEAHAIPASRLRKLVRDFEKFNRTGIVWVGLVFHNQTSTPEVLEVRDNSPARTRRHADRGPRRSHRSDSRSFRGRGNEPEYPSRT